MFRSTKTYGHELGLSAVFRQWRADSHCNQLHGYALSFRFEFESEDLDDKNWVVDFGGLSKLRKALEAKFDHKLLVAQDDPKLDEILLLQALGIADIEIVEAVGCEMFARLAYDLATAVLDDLGYIPRARVASVECSEHGANSAIYRPEAS
jgi:6-pyruvoyltetrahydropterin/6-carboxytetrahydropterin synthase